jgi:hypothetical protein
VRTGERARACVRGMFMEELPAELVRRMGTESTCGGWARMIQETRIVANIINSTTEAQSSQRTHRERRYEMGFGRAESKPDHPRPRGSQKHQAADGRAEGLPGGCPAVLTNTVKYYYCMRLAASFAGVAKPGQRRWIQGPVTKVFMGSNPIPRT